jgi:hypothetical protein
VKDIKQVSSACHHSVQPETSASPASHNPGVQLIFLPRAPVPTDDGDPPQVRYSSELCWGLVCVVVGVAAMTIPTGKCSSLIA